jgi:hypothetical protein
MFNYSNNFRDWLQKPEKPMSRSNITWVVKPKNTSEPRGNFSTLTAKRITNKKPTTVKSPKNQSEPVQSEVLENMNKKVEELVKPVFRPELKT